MSTFIILHGLTYYTFSQSSLRIPAHRFITDMHKFGEPFDPYRPKAWIIILRRIEHDYNYLLLCLSMPQLTRRVDHDFIIDCSVNIADHEWK